MNKKTELKTEADGLGIRPFLTRFLASLVRDLFQIIVAFAVGTAGGAIVCWYYEIPMGFSIIGGILVLGFALALTTDSWFD